VSEKRFTSSITHYTVGHFVSFQAITCTGTDNKNQQQKIKPSDSKKKLKRDNNLPAYTYTQTK